jgi:hypothetical protein
MGPGRVQLQWPKALGDAERRLVAQRALLRGWLADAQPPVAATLTPGIAVQARASTPAQAVSHAPECM